MEKNNFNNSNEENDNSKNKKNFANNENTKNSQNNAQSNEQNTNIENEDYRSSMYPDFDRKCMHIHTAKDDFKNVCDLIEVVEIIDSIDGGEMKLKIRTTNKNNKVREFIIPYSCLNSKESTYLEFCKHKVLLSSVNFAIHLSNYLSTETRKILDEGNASCDHHNIGWLQIEDEWCFCLENIIGTDVDSVSTRNICFKKGCKEDYLQFVQDTILPSKNLQLAMVLGFTSVVSSLLKENTGIKVLLINLLNTSSTGKSTVQHLMTSLFSDANISNNNLYRSFNGTYNALIKANAGINGVCINLDDTSSTGCNINWEEFTYAMTAGEGKLRCDADGSLKNTASDSWSGSIIVSSEEPLFYDEQVKNGAIARLLVAENICWTKDANESMAVKSFVKQNYGHLGEIFVERLIDEIKQNGGIDYLINEYHSEIPKIQSLVINPDGLTDRLCSQIALVALTSNLLSRLLNYDLDKDYFIDVFVQRENRQLQGRNITDEEKALEVVKDKIYENYQYFKTHKDYDLNKTYGAIEKKGNMYYIHIPQGEVEKWLYRFGNKVKDIFSKWKASGQIKSTKEEGRFTVRSSWLNNRRVMIFIFEEVKIEDDEQEESKNSSSNTSSQKSVIPAEILNISDDDEEDIDALFEDDITDVQQSSQDDSSTENKGDESDEN